MIKINQRAQPALDTIFFFSGSKVQSSNNSRYLFEESERLFSNENNADTVIEYDNLADIKQFMHHEDFLKVASSRKKQDGLLILVDLILTDDKLAIEFSSAGGKLVDAIRRSAEINFGTIRNLKLKLYTAEKHSDLFSAFNAIEHESITLGISRDLLSHTKGQPIDVDRFTAIQNTFLIIPPMLSGGLLGATSK